MKRFLLILTVALTACSQQRFEVLQQGSVDIWTVVYDRQTGKIEAIGSSGKIEEIPYPQR